MLSLGERIRQARKKAGLTQEELAEKINVSRSAVSRFENGDIVPRIDNLAELAQALDVSADYLIGLTDETTPVSFRISEKAAKALNEFIREMMKQKR